jgi:hypothetical protein
MVGVKPASEVDLLQPGRPQSGGPINPLDQNPLKGDA